MKHPRLPRNVPTAVLLAAIGAIAGMVMVGLATGHNGTLLTAGIGIVAYLAGWKTPGGGGS